MYCTATHMIGSAIQFLFTLRMRMPIEYELDFIFRFRKYLAMLVQIDFMRISFHGCSTMGDQGPPPLIKSNSDEAIL